MLLARDVMTPDVKTIRADTTVRELIERLRTTPYSGYPVVDRDGRVVGLVSRTDVLRALAQVIATDDLPAELYGARREAATRLRTDATAAVVTGLLGLSIADLMTPRIDAVRPDTPLSEVCALMSEKRIHRVVVCGGDGTCAGIISSLDLVRELARTLER